jgi:Delta7-sterol 5-desaturase
VNAPVGLDPSILELLATLPAWLVFAATCTAFAGLYFGAAAAALLARRALPGRLIDERPLAPNQVRDEILRSTRSIAVFGAFGVLTVAALTSRALEITWRAELPRVLLDCVLLLLWNDLHFYACHRLLHVPWLMKRVHHEHHRSRVATPFATYSFHWFEAVLLGSVMLTGLCLHPFHVFAVLLLPLASIALNAAGHSNFDPVPSLSDGAILATSRRHQAHHAKVTGNYGFLLPWFDQLFGTRVEP